MNAAAIRTSLLRELAAYRPFDPAEGQMLEELQQLVTDQPDCCDSLRRGGHVTASAWILNEGLNEVVLVHHGKLERWLQPGGHLEKHDISGAAAAAREGREETGLVRLRRLGGLFDVDVHAIPCRAAAPGHMHFDVRYAFIAGARQPFKVSPESRDLGWFSIEAPELQQAESLQRMVRKTRVLSARRAS